jgi:hypothetical protein
MVEKDDEENIYMINVLDPDIIINEEVYNRIVDYLRTMLDIHPLNRKSKNKFVTQTLIDDAEKDLAEKLEQESKKDTHFNESFLFPLISSALNHSGFKYKKSELEEVGIVEFMDSIKRLQIYESSTALMTGMYMGMIDMKKNKLNKELNWMRSLYS